MKKNYIIQDVNNPLNLICFDSLKSLKNWSIVEFTISFQKEL